MSTTRIPPEAIDMMRANLIEFIPMLANRCRSRGTWEPIIFQPGLEASRQSLPNLGYSARMVSQFKGRISLLIPASVSPKNIHGKGSLFSPN